jgi:hypothetical protein
MDVPPTGKALDTTAGRLLLGVLFLLLIAIGAWASCGLVLTFLGA